MITVENATRVESLIDRRCDVLPKVTPKPHLKICSPEASKPLVPSDRYDHNRALDQAGDQQIISKSLDRIKPEHRRLGQSLEPQLSGPARS
jgi:hypothetical protein